MLDGNDVSLGLRTRRHPSQQSVFCDMMFIFWKSILCTLCLLLCNAVSYSNMDLRANFNALYITRAFPLFSMIKSWHFSSGKIVSRMKRCGRGRPQELPLSLRRAPATPTDLMLESRSAHQQKALWSHANTEVRSGTDVCMWKSTFPLSRDHLQPGTGEWRWGYFIVSYLLGVPSHPFD